MWKKNSKIKHTNLSKIPVRIQNVKIRFLVLKLEFGKFNLCRISGFIIADYFCILHVNIQQYKHLARLSNIYRKFYRKLNVYF